MITDAYEKFSEALAGMIHDHMATGELSDVEVVGALRLVSAMIEAKHCGGKVNHITVVQVEMCEQEDEDSSESWKKG